MRRELTGAEASRLTRPALGVAALILCGLLGACVDAKVPLMTQVNPVLGEQFQANFFSDLAGGRAGSAQTAVFRWNGSRYQRTGGEVFDVKYLKAEPLDDTDFLVEATDEKDYVYFLAHKLVEATYGIRLIDENSLDAAAQKRLCVTQDTSNCRVETRAQLDAFVRATKAKAAPSGAVVVLSAP